MWKSGTAAGLAVCLFIHRTWLDVRICRDELLAVADHDLAHGAGVSALSPHAAIWGSGQLSLPGDLALHWPVRLALVS